jgi:plasmid maintenance system killer protein
VIRSLGDDATRDIWNHSLLGDLAGYHAIRVKDRCRVIFPFDGTDAHDVRCTDYH